MDTLLIISPFLVFLVIVAIVFFSIGNFSLKQAISETFYTTTIVDNELYKQDHIKKLLEIKPENTGLAASLSRIYPLTKQKTEEQTKISISRLIALISSILTIIVILFVCSFYIDCIVNSKPFPDMSGLIGVFVSLGVGVVPYSFNKLSGAISNKKNTGNLTNLQ